ncbi:uncharacterized protein LOC130671114 isoform X4 [Microplitis mediator]|uniref:uncharacterized protein LOC130671114 isoform X4 n=1 Tax=Microplitis mediator TaxID=375433 RepID=UPI002556B4E1|nr:uncharacterized protein LOC130671114 isoform X4 [Microplitis mediator]
MMLLITLVVITQSFGIQGAIDVVFEDTDCPFYDKEYFLEPEAFVNDQNALFSNITIIKRLPIETEARFTILGASMGEYVVLFLVQLDFLKTTVHRKFKLTPETQQKEKRSETS